MQGAQLAEWSGLDAYQQQRGSLPQCPVHQLFFQASQQQPDAAACVEPAGQLSYGHMQHLASCLAAAVQPAAAARARVVTRVARS